MTNHVRTKRLGIALAVIAGASLALPDAATADGYYYVAQSYYVTPPLMYNASPVFSSAPIVVYQPAVVAPPPVAGYYYPLAAPAARVRESGYSSPHRSRYRYEYQYPNGVEYKYRYKRDGGYVRVRERWDD